jgi:acyl carrier protein
MDRVTPDEIRAGACACVADSLALPRDAVKPDSRLFADLGADSLDFLDIVFQLEKRFGLRLQDTELDFLSRLDLSSPDVMRDGLLTEQALAGLRPHLPALATVRDPSRVSPRELFGLITVETLCILLAKQLDARA